MKIAGMQLRAEIRVFGWHIKNKAILNFTATSPNKARHSL
jgi:hypothetical protein